MDNERQPQTQWNPWIAGCNLWVNECRLEPGSYKPLMMCLLVTCDHLIVCYSWEIWRLNCLNLFVSPPDDHRRWMNQNVRLFHEQCGQIKCRWTITQFQSQGHSTHFKQLSPTMIIPSRNWYILRLKQLTHILQFYGQFILGALNSFIILFTTF